MNFAFLAEQSNQNEIIELKRQNKRCNLFIIFILIIIIILFCVFMAVSVLKK